MFIEFLNRKLKTDVAYVLRGGFWLIVGQGFSLISTFGLVWVFANYMTVEDYGVYRFLTTCLMIFTLASLPGINVSLTQRVAQGYTSLLRPMMLLKIKWGLIGSLGALILAGYYLHQGNKSLVILLTLVAIAVPLFDSFNIYQAHLHGKELFKQDTIAKNIHKALVVISTSLVVVITTDVLLALLTYLSSNILVSALLYISYARTNTHTETSPDSTVLEEAINYGKTLSILSVLRLSAQYIDKVILWYVAGPAQVAIYVIAMALPQEIYKACGQMVALALPRMSKRGSTDVGRTLHMKLLYYALAVVPIIVGYLIFAPHLFAWLLPQYTESIWYSQIAACAIVFVPVGLIMQYFILKKDTQTMYLMSIIDPMITLSLYAILTPLLGTLGLVLAFVGKSALSFACWFVMFTYSKKANRQHLFFE